MEHIWRKTKVGGEIENKKYSREAAKTKKIYLQKFPKGKLNDNQLAKQVDTDVYKADFTALPEEDKKDIRSDMLSNPAIPSVDEMNRAIDRAKALQQLSKNNDGIIKITTPEEDFLNEAYKVEKVLVDVTPVVEQTLHEDAVFNIILAVFLALITLGGFLLYILDSNSYGGKLVVFSMFGWVILNYSVFRNIKAKRKLYEEKEKKIAELKEKYYKKFSDEQGAITESVHFRRLTQEMTYQNCRFILIADPDARKYGYTEELVQDKEGLDRSGNRVRHTVYKYHLYKDEYKHSYRTITLYFINNKLFKKTQYDTNIKKEEEEGEET